jgi:hypothetical protein
MAVLDSKNCNCYIFQIHFLQDGMNKYETNKFIYTQYWKENIIHGSHDMTRETSGAHYTHHADLSNLQISFTSQIIIIIPLVTL